MFVSEKKNTHLYCNERCLLIQLYMKVILSNISTVLHKVYLKMILGILQAPVIGSAHGDFQYLVNLPYI